MASDCRTISWDISKCIYNQWRKEVKAGGDRDCRGLESQRRQGDLVEKQVWVLARHWRIRRNTQEKQLGDLTPWTQAQLQMGQN